MIKVSMRLIFSAAALALATFVGSDLARADWLSDAWSEDSVRRNGNPAITIQRDSIDRAKALFDPRIIVRSTGVGGR